MPVTAKLSRKFYDTLGDELTNELVEWFNTVDLTYRTELRSLNELNFARFDAKLEQRAVQLEAKIDRVAAELDAKVERFAFELNGKIDQFAAELNGKIDRVATELDAKIERRTAELRQEIAAAKSDLLKWMFLFWVGNVATTIGVAVAVVGLLR